MPTLIERLRDAGKAFLGRREERFVAHDFIQWFRNVGLPGHFKPELSLKAYGDNPWLHSAVNVICSEVSRTDFYLEQRTKSEWERVEKHEALASLKRPIPTKAGKSHLTQKQLMFLTGQYLLLNGEAFWKLDGRRRVNGAPTIIEPLLPQSVKLHFGSDNGIAYYSYDVSGKEQRFEPEDVVHFKTTNPEDFFRGHSPTKPIRFALDSHFEADLLNLARIQNNAVPAGILKSEQKISEDERKRYLASFKQMFGGAKNAGKIAFLPQGLDFSKVQESNAEMQFSEGKDRNRDEILANFRIGLEMLGRTEAQTRANADAAIYVFQKFVILPMVEMIVDTLNNDYLSQFPGTEDMRFSFPDPVPEDVEAKRQNAEVLSGMAGLTPDEARGWFGLEPLNIAGVTDVPYVDFSKVPAGEPPPLVAA